MSIGYEIDIDIETLTGQHRPISVNEARAVVKNRIEDRKLRSRMRMIRTENRFNCKCIGEIRHEAANSFSSIQMTTGYADGERNIQSAPAKFLTSFDTMNFSYSRSSLKSRNEPTTPSRPDSAASNYSVYDKKQVRFDDYGEDTSAKTSKTNLNENNNNNNNNMRSKSSLGLSINKKSDFTVERKVRSALSRSREQSNSFSSEPVKKIKNEIKIEIEDENEKVKVKEFHPILTKPKYSSIYFKLLTHRDKIPKRTPEQIEELKKKDPVFAKRHKQYISAKICNKAPKFDFNDYFIRIAMPKTIINRNKNEIIKELHIENVEKPKIFKIEMDRVDAKVKKFVREFSGF